MARADLRNWAFGTVAAVVLVAGCGGPQHADTSAIRGALGRSSATYWHFRAQAWWGKDPDVTISLIRVDGSWAAARIDAPLARHFVRQWVLLHRAGRRWRVVETRVGHATDFDCKRAPAPVIPRLVGGCTIGPDVTESGLVQGPSATRPPTAFERHGIESNFVARILAGRRVCPPLTIRVSRLDGTWADASADTCGAAGNGIVLYHRSAHGWTIAGEASDGFGCVEAPPGVVRSLEGSCWTS